MTPRRRRIAGIEVDLLGFASNDTGGGATLRIIDHGPFIAGVSARVTFDGTSGRGTLSAALPVRQLTIPTGAQVEVEAHWAFPVALRSPYRLVLRPVLNANGTRRTVRYSFAVKP